MARWVWPTAAGVVTSATGVVINLATDQESNPWTWAAVVLLTAVGMLVGVAARRAETPVSVGDVQNTITGTVGGNAVQTGTLKKLIINGGSMSADSSINQSAHAHDGSTIYQAGRDIRHDRNG